MVTVQLPPLPRRTAPAHLLGTFGDGFDLTQAQFNTFLDTALEKQLMDKRAMYSFKKADEHDGHDEHDEHDEHGHRRLLAEDGHDEHGDEHGDEHDCEAWTLSADDLFERHSRGTGVITADGLEAASAEVLACMADPKCVVASDGVTIDVHGGHDHRDQASLRDTKWILAGVILVQGYLGGVIPSFIPLLLSPKGRSVLSFLAMASGGAFLATATMHLLPEAFEMQAALRLKPDYPLVGAMVIVGFVLFFAVEHVMFSHSWGAHHHGGHDHEHDHEHGHEHGHHHHDHHHGHAVVKVDAHDQESGQGSQASGASEARPFLDHVKSSLVDRRGALLLLLGLVIHSMLEGFALGLTESRSSMWAIAIAIMSHKFLSDSLAVGVRLLSQGAKRAEVCLWMIPISLSSPLGVVIGMYVAGTNAYADAALRGLSAGTYLYVGAFDVLAHELVHLLSPAHSHSHHKDTALDAAPAEADDCPVTTAPHNCSDSTRSGARRMLFGFCVGCFVIMMLGFIPGSHDHAH